MPLRPLMRPIDLATVATKTLDGRNMKAGEFSSRS